MPPQARETRAFRARIWTDGEAPRMTNRSNGRARDSSRGRSARIHEVPFSRIHAMRQFLGGRVGRTRRMLFRRCRLTRCSCNASAYCSQRSRGRRRPRSARVGESKFKWGRDRIGQKFPFPWQTWLRHSAPSQWSTPKIVALLYPTPYWHMWRGTRRRPSYLTARRI